MGNRRRADRGQVEQRLLILVTLGLVAFGLVMVFSATSASATLGEGDPMRFLVKQGLYAVAGLVLLAVFSRVDYHLLRPLAHHEHDERQHEDADGGCDRGGA